MNVEDSQTLKHEKAKTNVTVKLKKNKKTGNKPNKFTAAEDEVIKAAMNAEGKVDIKMVGKQIGRNPGSVNTRAELLRRTGGKMNIKPMTLAEDLTNGQ